MPTRRAVDQGQKCESKYESLSRGMDYKFLTYRELLRHRRIATRSIQRKRHVDKSQALVDRIDTELASRRAIKFEHAARRQPTLYPGVKNDEI